MSAPILTQDTLKTPYFMFDEARFCANVNAFRAALEKHHDKITIGYSVKTNYTPAIVATARDIGCVAEVVSRMELDLAKRLKFPTGSLIFNGPVKTADDMRMAVEMGGMINLDSLDQIDTFLTLDQDICHSARIGLRLNVDLSAGLKDQSKIAKGGIVPRFGLPTDGISEAITRLRKAGLTVHGLHGHASSSDRKPDNYTRIALTLLEVCKTFDLGDVEVLDIGGGFSGSLPEIWNMPDSPNYEDYASAIFEPLTADSWFQAHSPHVAIEPGMGILADCMTYVTEVISVKEVMGRQLAGVDGTYYDVRPTLHTKPLPARLIGNQSEPEDGADQSYIVVGSTCMERDVLLDAFQSTKPLSVGDRIEIGNVGAYTLVLSPHFITYAAGAYGQRADGSLYEMRRHQRFDDFFAPYTF